MLEQPSCLPPLLKSCLAPHYMCSTLQCCLTGCCIPSIALQAELGDQYKLYLLENQEEKPVSAVGRKGVSHGPCTSVPVGVVPLRRVWRSSLGRATKRALCKLCQSHAPPHRRLPCRSCALQVAVVLPLASVLPQFGPLPEPALAALLGLTTVATTLNINGAELFNAALLTVGWDPAAVSEALPGTAAFLAILGE